MVRGLGDFEGTRRRILLSTLTIQFGYPQGVPRKGLSAAPGWGKLLC